jgi:membrane-associated protein
MRDPLARLLASEPPATTAAVAATATSAPRRTRTTTGQRRSARSVGADERMPDRCPSNNRPEGRRPSMAYGLRVSASPRPDTPAREPRPLPWPGRGERADWIILAGIALSALVPLLLLPLVPALVTSHPALLELIRGSTASIINMGARARIGDASLVAAVLLGVPSLMMFDWVFWWAGRRWGDGVFVWLLGGPGPKTEQRLQRLHRIESRVGPFAVVLAYLLPIPSPLIYAAVGDGGMRLGVFLALDVIGTVLWTGLLAAAGYGFGRHAVDVADAVSHYGLWVAAALVVVVAVRVRRRAP